MEDESNFRLWADLIPDALGLIFQKLPLQDVLTVVPRVCKSWERAVAGPYCWQEIDIEEWSMNSLPENIDRMLRLLIPRCQGSLRKLRVSCVSNKDTFAFIADNAKYLHTLGLPRSEIDECLVEELAEKFSNVTVLDISYCNNMGEIALDAFGTHCKNLKSLCRTMHPLEVIDKISQDDEALAIADAMPNLKQLEIAYMLVSTECVVEIIKSCPQLELLDVRGCWSVSLDEEFLKKFPGLRVVGPAIVDCYAMDRWDDCSDNSDSSGFFPWDMDDGDEDDDGLWEVGEGVEDVEMWFYDGSNSMNAGYDWPQSP
ncbi:hypothetical protein DM860_004740 [Cuscuta australis]|uniref:F-box domain-containing protein n=1 Tax=Cuscuta australis TaxID=267555 RepID=A0A328DQC6_9ASTE|nr:hypothetical protein DM860_004740 [Cuscuta australis]